MSIFVEKIIKDYILEVGDLSNIKPFPITNIGAEYSEIIIDKDKIRFYFTPIIKKNESVNGIKIEKGIFEFSFTINSELDQAFVSNTNYLFRLYKTCDVLIKGFMAHNNPDALYFGNNDDRKMRIYNRYFSGINPASYNMVHMDISYHENYICYINKKVNYDVKGVLDAIME